MLTRIAFAKTKASQTSILTLMMRNLAPSISVTFSSLFPSCKTTMTQQQQQRPFFSTPISLFSSNSSTTTDEQPYYSKPSLSDFRDTAPLGLRVREPVGRSWTVQELRRKSFVDCHKLWLVLYKERNMLLTEKALASSKNTNFPQPNRLYKVRKSMAAIRHVLGERKREKLAAVAAAQEEKRLAAATAAAAAAATNTVELEQEGK